MSFADQRNEVAYFMRRLYRQGLTTTSGGNVSCRIDDRCIALSASASDKAELQADQVGLMALDGRNLTPDLKPSIESEMHLAIYRRHSSVKAVVHAHPVTASLFSASSRPISTRLTAEAYAILGEPVATDYACMGTAALAENVSRALDRGVCILLRNHGILTVGANLLQAFDRLEVLEVAARQTVLAAFLDDVTELDAAQCCQLDELMGR